MICLKCVLLRVTKSGRTDIVCHIEGVRWDEGNRVKREKREEWDVWDPEMRSRAKDN